MSCDPRGTAGRRARGGSGLDHPSVAGSVRAFPKLRVTVERLSVGASMENQRACRILVVDDNPDTIQSMSILLQMLRHEVFTAVDGPTALETAAHAVP